MLGPAALDGRRVSSDHRRVGAEHARPVGSTGARLVTHSPRRSDPLRRVLPYRRSMRQRAQLRLPSHDYSTPGGRQDVGPPQRCRGDPGRSLHRRASHARDGPAGGAASPYPDQDDDHQRQRPPAPTTSNSPPSNVRRLVQPPTPPPRDPPPTTDLHHPCSPRSRLLPSNSHSPPTPAAPPPTLKPSLKPPSPHQTRGDSHTTQPQRQDLRLSLDRVHGGPDAKP